MFPRAPFRAIAGLILFGISFGYLEAAVVVYLRAIYQPLRERVHPRAPDDLFPLITRDQVVAFGNRNTLAIELGREVATLLMLAGIGLTAGRTPQQWLAAFLVAFGLWDATFYGFLQLLIGWPNSLLTWDLLFLVPVPWVGPVLAPVIVSLSMVAGGLTVLLRPVLLRPLHWLGIVGGGCILLAAFMYDFRNISAGGSPQPFAWGLFTIGELLAVTAFLAAVVSRGHPESQKRRGSVEPQR